VRGTALRTLSIVALLYVIEGFPMGIYADVLPVFLRRHALSTTAIGLLSSLSIAWALKVLWSPLVDRYGERRRWITGALLMMSACLAALGAGDPLSLGGALWLVIGAFCVASATQDIAIDAYTIALVPRGEEGPVNSVRVIAYRVGLIASGGALLFLPRWIGWPGTFAVAAAAFVVMALTAQACPRLPVPDSTRREALVPVLRRWLDRPGAVSVLLFILLYRVGDRAMGPMVKPFWVDRGFTDEEIGLVSNTLGVLATIAGAGVGGLVVARIGIARALLALGAAALLSNLGYAAAALPEMGRPPVYAASLLESFCSGLASVAFLSFLMRITQKEHAAVQYALLTAIYALSGSLVAAPSGWWVERVGYAAWFAITALLALPAFAFLPGARAWLEAADLTDPAPASASRGPHPAGGSTPPEPRPDSPPPRDR
jgi:PAT family beta-lactamase induction signal transducer AmpG